MGDTTMQRVYIGSACVKARQEVLTMVTGWRNVSTPLGLSGEDDIWCVGVGVVAKELREGGLRFGGVVYCCRRADCRRFEAWSLLLEVAGGCCCCCCWCCGLRKGRGGGAVLLKGYISAKVPTAAPKVPKGIKPAQRYQG